MEKEHGEDWSRIKTLVRPEIDSLRTYEKACNQGLFLAGKLVQEACDKGSLSIDTIKAAHYVAFHKVYPFAGEFRPVKAGADEEVQVGNVAWEVPFPTEVAGELSRLIGFFERSTGPDHRNRGERAAMVALFHAQFERIHPFTDGNGRIGRLFLRAQAKKLLDIDYIADHGRSSYFSALKLAQAVSERSSCSGDLGPLTKVLTGVDLAADERRLPYRMGFWPITLQREVVVGKCIKVSCEDIDTAYDVYHADIDPKLAAAVRSQPKNWGVDLDLVRKGDRLVLTVQKRRQFDISR